MFSLSKTHKTNHQLRIISFAIAGFTAVLLMGGFLIRGADAQQHLPIDIVYTETNIPTENGNSILGFQRDASGTLTSLPTSPFPTGGAGIANATIVVNPVINTTFLSDQEVLVNPEHTRLFAVNSGSSTIAVFDINQDGSLSPVKGSPFPSGGVEPVSLGLAGNFLYVVNQNLDPQKPSQEASDSLPNYTAFRVTPRGRLVSVNNSTISVPEGSIPAQALISPNKHLLFGADTGSGLLRSYQILWNGRLLNSPNSPQSLPASASPAGGPLPVPLGLQVHPQQPILYVGFTNINKLGVYSYDKDTGELTFLKAVPSSGIAICWIATNRGGTRLYTSNPGDNSISVYDIAQDPTTPVEIQKVTLKGPGGDAQLTLDSTESFLQVVSQPISTTTTEGNGLHVLAVTPQDGTLSEVSSSPLPLPSVDNSFIQGIVALHNRGRN